METKSMNNSFVMIKEGDSILFKLKNSIDYVNCVRRKNPESPKKLEIKMDSSYILKDRALELNVLPSITNEHPPEKPTTHYRKASASQFGTRIQFVRPSQKSSEGSPCSVDSDKPRKPPLNNRFCQSPSTKEKRSPGSEKENSSILHKKYYDVEPTVKQSPFKEKDLIIKAKEEIMELRKNKERLSNRVNTLQVTLKKIQKAKKHENETIASIGAKLEKLEKQQIDPEEDPRLPQAIANVAKLESEIVQLKSLKNSSAFQYEEELKDVYHKLKDLKECNEILSEMLACFRKEPLFSDPRYTYDENSIAKLDKDIFEAMNMPSPNFGDEPIEVHCPEFSPEAVSKSKITAKPAPGESRIPLSKARKWQQNSDHK